MCWCGYWQSDAIGEHQFGKPVLVARGLPEIAFRFCSSEQVNADFLLELFCITPFLELCSFRRLGVCCADLVQVI